MKSFLKNIPFWLIGGIMGVLYFFLLQLLFLGAEDGGGFLFLGLDLPAMILSWGFVLLLYMLHIENSLPSITSIIIIITSNFIIGVFVGLFFDLLRKKSKKL